ncbi:hypothetical protein [Acinetobacter radioresistens]|uniref:hypothetical protein n=1 Tax=Acinetobacter radioresistens TaxID=40216 RepID=UPI00291C5468|nr:hypothetical protein [Acinetobacter radioresistens]
MDNNLFDDLVASIKEAGAIKRNEVQASRVTELTLPDIKEVREKTGLSQTEFAARLHMMCAELAGDFHLGDSRQLTDKSLLPFDLVS